MADMPIGSATYQIKADTNNLLAGLVTAEKATRKTFNNITKIMTGFAVAAAGAAAAGFGAFFNEAIKQQKAFQESFTLLPDISKEVFGKLARDAKYLAARLNVEWEDMSKGLYSAISSGIPEDEVISFLEKASKAAAGGVATLAESVKAGTTAVNSLREQGIGAERAFDIYFSTIRKGETTMSELSGSIGYLLPVANALGISFEEISAMISTLTVSGIKTRVTMTSLRAGLAELADSSYKAGSAIQELTGKTFMQLIDSGRDAGSIINDLYKSVGKAEFFEMFGQESRAGMLSLVGEGYKKYSEDLKAARESAGAAQDAFEKMAQTISFSMGVAGKTIKQIFTDIAGNAIPLVTNLFDETIMPAIDKFYNWFVENEDFIKDWFESTWNSVIPHIKDFIRGFVEIGKAAWNFISLITENKVLLVAALTAFGVAMTASFGPAAPAIAGIGLLITLFGDLKEKWDDIVSANPTGTWFSHGQALVTAVGEGIRSAAISMWNALVDSLLGLRKLLPFSDAEAGPLSDLTASGMAIPYTIAEGIRLGASALIDSAYYALMHVADVLNSARSSWFNFGLNIASTLADGIVFGATVIYNAVVGVFASLRNLLPFSDAKEGPLSDLTLSGESIIITLANGIRISSSQLTDEAINALSSLEDVLLGDGWMPNQGDVDRALNERISFTSVVEKNKGIIQSIDWGSLIEGGADQASRALSGGLDRFGIPFGSGAGYGAGAGAGAGAGGGVGGLGGGEKGGIGEGGGLGLSDMVDTDAVKESAAEVAQAVVDGVKETMDSYPHMWESLYPPGEDLQSAWEGFIAWIKAAIGGVIDLSGWKLPKWLSDDDGNFQWPDIQSLIPTTIVVPEMDLSSWELPGWLSDDDGYFEWPTPGDFAWGEIGKPTWPEIIWPPWLSNDEGEFQWPTPKPFKWPAMPGINWDNVTFPPWLTDSEGNFSWPDPGPFPAQVWLDAGNKAVQSLLDGMKTALVGRQDEVTPFGMIIPGESGAATGLLEAGKTIVSTISDGVTTAKQTLYDAVFGVFGWVKDLLFPSSDAKEGPFKNLTESGKSIITTIAAGVTLAQQVLMDAMTGVFNKAVAIWETLPAKIQSILHGTPASTLDMGSGYQVEVPAKEGVLDKLGLGEFEWPAWPELPELDATKISDSLAGVTTWLLENVATPSAWIPTISKVDLDSPFKGVGEWLEENITPLSWLPAIALIDVATAFLPFIGWLIGIKVATRWLPVLGGGIVASAFLPFTRWRNNQNKLSLWVPIAGIIRFFAGMGLALVALSAAIIWLPQITASDVENAWGAVKGWTEEHLTGGDLVPEAVQDELRETIDKADEWINNSFLGRNPDQSEPSMFGRIIEWLLHIRDILNEVRDAYDAAFSWAKGGGDSVSIENTVSNLLGLPGDIGPGIDELPTASFIKNLASSIAVVRTELEFIAGISAVAIASVMGAFFGWFSGKRDTEFEGQLQGFREEQGRILASGDPQQEWIQARFGTVLEGGLTGIWDSVGDALVAGWESYSTNTWPTHRDLIQTGIWNTLTSYGEENERPAGATFSTFWKAVGSALKTDWDEYLVTDWPAHKDLIQAGLWNAIIGSQLGPGTRPEGATFAMFWKAVGAQLKVDWALFVQDDWPDIRDTMQAGLWNAIIGNQFGWESGRPADATFAVFWKAVGAQLKVDWALFVQDDWPDIRETIQVGLWNALTSYGEEKERPEGATFAAFWKALGSALKTDWDAYVTTTWPTHSDLIQGAIWNSLFAGDIIRPEGVSFSNFWVAVGTQIKDDFNSFIANDWPGIRDEISSSLLSAIAGIFGVGAGPQGETPESETLDALSDSLNPALQLGAGGLAMGQADKLGNNKLWHAGRPLGLWQTQKGETRKARSPKGIIPNIKWSSIIKGAGIAAAIQASVALVEIWVPKITGTDLETHWANALDWIRENIADQWLSEETKTGLNNFAQFLIDAGATAGTFETIGTNIQTIVGNVEKLYGLSPTEEEQRFPVSLIGEVALTGFELAADFVWDNLGLVAVLAGPFKSIPWLKRSVWPKIKGPVQIYIAFVVTAVVDKFVLKPFYGDELAYEGEGVWEQSFRRVLSSIIGEKEGKKVAIEMNEAGGFWEAIDEAWEMTFDGPMFESVGDMQDRRQKMEDASNELEGLFEYQNEAFSIESPGKPGLHQKMSAWEHRMETWWQSSVVEPIKDFFADKMPTWWKDLWGNIKTWWQEQYEGSREPIELDISWLTHPIADAIKNTKINLSPIWDAFRSKLPTWLGGTGGEDDAARSGKVPGLMPMAKPDMGFFGNLLAPGGPLSGILSKLPAQIQMGIGGGVVEGMLDGNIAGGALSGLMQGVVHWLADQIGVSEVDFSSIREAIMGVFSFDNWFGGGEDDANAGETGEDLGVFSPLFTGWVNLLSGIVTKTIGWIPELVTSFSPEGGWLVKIEEIFKPMETGTETVLTNIKTSFTNAITIIEGLIKKISDAWEKAMGLIRQVKNMVGLGEADIGPEGAVSAFNLGDVNRGGGGGKDAERYAYASGGIAKTPQIATLAEGGKPEYVLDAPKMHELLRQAVTVGIGMRPVYATGQGGFGGGGGGGHTTVNITIEGNVEDGEDFEDKVASTFVDLQRTGKLSIYRE